MAKRITTVEGLIKWMASEVRGCHPQLQMPASLIMLHVVFGEELARHRNAIDLRMTRDWLGRTQPPPLEKYCCYEGLREFLVDCCDAEKCNEIGPVLHFFRTGARLIGIDDQLADWTQQDQGWASVRGSIAYKGQSIRFNVELPMPRKP